MQGSFEPSLSLLTTASLQGCDTVFFLPHKHQCCYQFRQVSAFKFTPQESQASTELQVDVTNKTDVAENAFGAFQLEP